ncbi:unnamed protein product [Coccothraustes coccothraustes]
MNLSPLFPSAHAQRRRRRCRIERLFRAFLSVVRMLFTPVAAAMFAGTAVRLRSFCACAIHLWTPPCVPALPYAFARPHPEALNGPGPEPGPSGIPPGNPGPEPGPTPRIPR